MDAVKLPRPRRGRAERFAVILLAVLLAVGFWQAYGVLLFGRGT